MSDSAADLKDNGDRKASKVSNGVDKGTDSPEVEILDRQMAPKVSVKVERQQNLGHYNNVSAQVFFSSGTLEEYRGELLNEEGEVKEEVRRDLANIAENLQELARNRVIDAIKEHAKRGIDVDEEIHEVDTR